MTEFPVIEEPLTGTLLRVHPGGFGIVQPATVLRYLEVVGLDDGITLHLGNTMHSFVSAINASGSRMGFGDQIDLFLDFIYRKGLQREGMTGPC